MINRNVQVEIYLEDHLMTLSVERLVGLNGLFSRGDPNHLLPGMILQYMFQKYEPKERVENTIRFFGLFFFFSLGFFEKNILVEPT